MFIKITRKSLITLIVLTLIFTLGLSIRSIAQSEQTDSDVVVDKITVPDGSVLNLIPHDSLGLIYCPSLNALDNRIRMMVDDLMPQSGQGNLLAQILAGSFGAGFESLDELEEIGLDMDSDFAVFFLNVQPMHVSAAIHLTDPDAMMEVIETEAADSEPTVYEGVTYWNTPDGSGNFLILENTLIFSQDAAVCNKVIDTHNDKSKSIIQNADSSMLSADILNGTDQLSIYFNFDIIASELDSSIEEVLSGITEDLEFQDDPIMAELAPSIKRGVSSIAGFLDHLNYISVSLQVKDTDIQFKPFMKFKDDSEMLKDINETSDELSNIDILPNVSMVNCAFQGVPQLLVSFSTFWFDVFPKDPPGQQKELNPLFQEVKNHYESLADRWNMSVDFKDYIVPNYLFIYELKDEESANSFMNKEFLEKLQSQYDAYAGESIMYNNVEIKSYIFPEFEMPNQGDLPIGSDLVPSEWHWHYAFTDGHLYFTTGTSDEAIKAALDCRTDEGDKFSGNPSYQTLVESLGTDNNVFLAISPIIAIKNFMPILGKADPNSAAALQMFMVLFTNLPDNYSIGVSAKTHNNGIDAKLLLTLGDFRQLINMFSMVMGGVPMQ